MVMDSKLGKSGGEVYRVSRKKISVDTVERAINLDTNEFGVHTTIMAESHSLRR